MGGVGGSSGGGGMGGVGGSGGAGEVGGMGGVGGSGGVGGRPSCEPTASDALRACVKTLNDTTRACYTNTDAPCAQDDRDITGALARLQDTVRDVCGDGSGLLSGDALAARFMTACELESASIAARAFGGPHGAVWSSAHPAVLEICLAEPHRVVSELVDTALQGRNACLAAGSCDASSIELQEQALRDQAVADVTATCSFLSDIIAIDPAEFVQRTMDQVDCLTAISHADTDPLVLRCGPTTVTRDPPPAPRPDGYMKIVLNSNEYGTRCGGDVPYYPADNPYAFHVKLAPAGEPIENVVIYFEGGGVCVTDDTVACFDRYLEDPSLFEAQNSVPHTSGIMSDDETVSPFAKWTKVYLEYCTQDLHSGNGLTNQFGYGPFTVHRYGAINARTAIRYVRDLIWKELDAQGGEGYRSDRLRVAFGGFSAGGYGSLYNYHWVLDDLQWPHATAFPDSALALDNAHDQFWRISVLASIAFANWKALPTLPPYCFSRDCVVGPYLLAAHAQRLKAVPEQQYMIISNQNDEFGQMETTFFNRGTTWEQGRVNWINAARLAYCDTRELTGVNYFLMAFAQTLHSTSMDDYWVSQVFVAGETMGSWLGSAFSDPDGVVDRVEEGDLTQVYNSPPPGVQPFPCPL
jgi:hypothetical protein